MNGVRLMMVALVLLGLSATTAFAQDDKAAGSDPSVVAKKGNWGIGFGAGIGAAGVILGAGYGISTIAGKAVESMARQPEVAGNISGAMIVSAALIEGVSFFALIVCILVLVLA